MIGHLYIAFSTPWWKVLGWLVLVTGKPSSFFSRVAVCIFTVLSFGDSFLAWRTRRDWWEFDLVVWLLFVLIAVPWAWRLIDKVERATRSGSETSPLSEGEFGHLMWFGVIYTGLALLTLPAVVIPALFPVCYFLIGVAAAWIPVGHGGSSQSAWARFKTRIRIRVRAAAPVAEGAA